MPRILKVDEEIALLEKQRNELEKRLKAAHERRQQEERRKLVAGNIVLHFMRSNPNEDLTTRLAELLDRNLGAADRPLFAALPGLGGSAGSAPKPDVAGQHGKPANE